LYAIIGNQQFHYLLVSCISHIKFEGY